MGFNSAFKGLKSNIHVEGEFRRFLGPFKSKSCLTF